jgi:hypothetical protein
MLVLKIVWFAMALSTQGQLTQLEPTQDMKTFTSVEECNEYGNEMKNRAADWFRGRENFDWNVKMKIGWKCMPNGQQDV